MKASVLLHILLQGVLLFDVLGWEVRMPEKIHGLKGSCLVIPCSFSYTSDPPKNPRSVVWYKYVSRGYPLVYHPLEENKVIEEFRGKTDLYGNSSGDCSLLIRKLEQSHHEKKLYTWIDPDNVKQRFYDFTSTILVDTHPQPPSISISGGEKMGDKITVTCSAFHTCPYSKPNITLKGIEGSDQINDECSEDGQCRTNLTRLGVVNVKNITFECSVTHHGGINTSASKDKSALCVHQNITIEPEMANLAEGVEQIFTCTVYHSCQENLTITWNYENMQVSEGTKTLSGSDQVAYSTITFLGTTEDDGKYLTCTAQFSGGNITASVALYVQCVPQNITIEPEIAEVTEGVEQNFTCTVHHSCQKENPTITWNYANMQVSKGRKTLSGSDQVAYSTMTFLGTTEDDGKYLTCNAQFSGGNITASVALYVQCVPQNITIEPEIAEVTEGVEQNFTCTVHHSCQKENPNITWNYANMQVSEGRKTLSGFDQLVYSTIAFLGAKEDHGKKLICSGKFSGGNFTAFVALHVPSFMMVIRLKTIGIYIVTPSLVFIFACILVGVIICKKRHRPKKESTVHENNPLSKPDLPSPNSDPKLQPSENDADLYVNLKDLYENLMSEQ